MLKLVADITISLDGYFTSPKNEIDWFGFDSDEWVWSPRKTHVVHCSLLMNNDIDVILGVLAKPIVV